VPLPNVVAEALAEHIAHFPPAADGSLFTTATGMLYRQDHYSARIFKPAVLASQLPGSTSSHDLRHHYTSLLLAAGESVITVAERLGDTPAMVLKVYGHVLPDSEDRTRKAIDAAWDDGHLTATAHG
jgi:integrase